MEGYEKLLTRAEVARMCRVDPKTVGRWARAGKLTEIPTPGGYPRYRESEVRALLDPDDRPGPTPGCSPRPGRSPSSIRQEEQ